METDKRGTKRKYNGPSSEDLGTRVKGKLHHSVREVKKAAKKAKTFEIQRAIKKLKDLRKKDENSKYVPEAETCLQLLKNADHEDIGVLALASKIKKTKILHDNPIIQEAVTQELPIPTFDHPTDPLHGKIQSRLLSSKVLAEEVHSVIENLKGLIIPKPPTEETVVDEEEGPFKKAKKEKSKGSTSGGAKSTKAPSQTPSKVDQGKDEEDLGGFGEGVSDDEVDEAGWESGTVDEEADDPGWESGSVLDEEVDLGASSDEESGNDNDSEDPPVKRAKPSKPSASAANPTTKSSAVSSTFLPSLSVGYIQGSDSEFSDSEAKIADPEIKKNRRGQRARRAIWEKKYGRGANHKKKEAEENQKLARAAAERKDRKSRPSASRIRAPTATELQNRPKDGGWAGMPNTRDGSASTRPPPPAQKRPAEQKALHPSWEAKKKQKEKEGVGIIPSQGKKIVF